LVVRRAPRSCAVVPDFGGQPVRISAPLSKPAGPLSLLFCARRPRPRRPTTAPGPRGSASRDHKGRPNPPHYYCKGHHADGPCPARASARHTVVDPYIEAQLLAAFGDEGPLAEARTRHDRLEEALRELEAARYALSQYVSNTTLIETVGIDVFTTGAEAHQQQVDLAEMALAEAKTQQEAVGELMDGNLLQAWTSGELTPLERRTIVGKMIDRVVLFPSKRPGKRSGKDIGDRVQIILRGNELLSPTTTPTGSLAPNQAH
jgi:hypothetical protein